MASFNDHIAQAHKNLQFLGEVNENSTLYWDWQVTIAFYVGVHLINAHCAQTIDVHYRSHNSTQNGINPYKSPVSMTGAEVPEAEFLAYSKLKNFSRRSRYLCNHDVELEDNTAQFTNAKHFFKALKNLDKLLSYCSSIYGIEFSALEIDCNYLDKNSLQYFKYRKQKPVGTEGATV